ncbi:hypothetical protein CEXT_593781 [Caerostris extrusa]|uniref:Uncharacterized protein n=1 Tax=Caerostris extrusa TaxID=172846 RepID=A0AAV4Q6A7_CAEEX|nr:hypothetical protein CEXT_593781 [Caerostris extrusa]
MRFRGNHLWNVCRIKLPVTPPSCEATHMSPSGNLMSVKGIAESFDVGGCFSFLSGAFCLSTTRSIPAMLFGRWWLL